MNTEMTDVTQNVTTQTFATADTIVGGSDFTDQLPESTMGTDYAQSIAKFMERPLQIYAQSSISPSFQIFPWVELLSNVNIAAKLHNYRFLRGTLNVRVTANCTAFTYGLYVLSVRYGEFTTHPIPTTEFQWTSAFNAEHYHMDLACKDEIVVKIPFFHTYPFIHTDPIFFFAEHASLAKLTFFPVFAPRNANGVVSPTVNIKAYAWVTDLQLHILEPLNSAAPAALVAGLADLLTLPRDGGTTHSRIWTDEEIAEAQSDESDVITVVPESGPVSGPLNILATKVRNVGDVMVQATDMAHSVVRGSAKVAQLLGFSRPQGQENTTGYWPDYFGDSASTSGVYHARNLTMDPGSLVNSLHSRSADRGDELSLSKIMERESFYSIETIPVGGGFLDYEIPVAPCYYHLDGTSTVQYTNMGFATAPFTYWRGSIDFHFRVVASNYHSGRMGVMFSPDQFSTDLNSLQNISSNSIFDIRAGYVHTVRVHWARAEPYSIITPLETSPATRPGLDYCNGYLRLYSVDNLVAPVDGALAHIIITMTPGPDFEVAVPSSYALNNLIHHPLLQPTVVPGVPIVTNDASLIPPAGAAIPLLRVVPESSVIGSTVVEFNTISPLDQNERCFGDPVVSFRALLKRMEYSFTAGRDTPLTIAGNGYYFSMPPYGLAVGKQNLSATDTWTDSKMCLLTYLLPAYTGVRGSTYIQVRARREIQADAAASRNQFSWPCIIVKKPAPLYMRGVVPSANLFTFEGLLRSGFMNAQGLDGTAAFDCATAAPLVHVPYHLPADFIRPRDYLAQNTMTSSSTLFPGAVFYNFTKSVAQRAQYWDVWYATGDDFDLLHYNGPPPMQYYVPPVPET